MSIMIDDVHKAWGPSISDSRKDWHVDRDSNQLETTTRTTSSQLPSSELTPLKEEVEEIQTSSAHRLMQLSKQGSPVLARDSQRDIWEPPSSHALYVLEEEAHMVNKWLRIACKEHSRRTMSSRTKCDSRSTSSYENINNKHSQKSHENDSTRGISDENIDKAMCNLHMPVRRPNETPGEYQARQAASAWLRKRCTVEKVEQRLDRAHKTILVELN